MDNLVHRLPCQTQSECQQLAVELDHKNDPLVIQYLPLRSLQFVSRGLALTPRFLTQLQVRAVILGLLIGTLLCYTNLYFGLQTGWVSMLVQV